jgi:hypothetical protein
MAVSIKATLRKIPGGIFLFAGSKAQPINLSAQAAPIQIAA